MSLLCVLGEPLQHCGTRRNVPFTAGDGSEMRGNFKVTDATRPILSVRKVADTGATTIFKPCGEGKIIRDATAIQKLQKICATMSTRTVPTSWTRKQARGPVDSTCSQQQTGTSREPSGKRNTRESVPLRLRSTGRFWTKPGKSAAKQLAKPPTRRHSMSGQNTR